MKRNGLTAIVFDEAPPNTDYTVGRWSWVSDDTAQKYIEEGYGREWKPKIEVTNKDSEEVETITPKPLEGTVKEIKDWLDKNDVEYSSTSNKPELLEILKEA